MAKQIALAALLLCGCTSCSKSNADQKEFLKLAKDSASEEKRISERYENILTRYEVVLDEMEKQLERQRVVLEADEKRLGISPKD